MSPEEEPTRPETGPSPSWLSRLFRSSSRPAPGPRVAPAVLAAALAGASSQAGETLDALSHSRPRLVVLLRHLGCSFCRETLADLARHRQRIERAGVGVVLVHLARDDQRAGRLFAVYELADAPRIADPERILYRALGLDPGSLGDLLGPHVLIRAVTATCRGHLPGRTGQDTASRSPTTSGTTTASGLSIAADSEAPKGRVARSIVST